MATTLQNRLETIVNEAVETAQTNINSVLEDTRGTVRKAFLAHVGLFALAYDHAKSLTKSLDSIVDDAGERAVSLYESAVERGESIEGVAIDRAEKIRVEATERFGDIESRIRQTLGHAEATVTEEVEVIETVASEVQEEVIEVVEEAVEMVAVPFEGYGDLTARDVIGQMEEMTSEQLTAIKAYESANANRVTVIREVDRRLAG